MEPAPACSLPRMPDHFSPADRTQEKILLPRMRSSGCKQGLASKGSSQAEGKSQKEGRQRWHSRNAVRHGTHISSSMASAFASRSKPAIGVKPRPKKNNSSPKLLKES